MKTYLHAFAMCQSKFCSSPCPWKLWDEEARDKMLLALPWVGLEIGVLWFALAFVMERLGLPKPVEGLLLCAYPYWITGGIHLDGFMDVSDAVGSCRPLERRREILKDAHVGSFAVIGLVLVILSQYVLFLSAGEGKALLIFLPAVSRCCSALAITGLKPMASSQYAGQTGSNARLWALLLTLLAFLAVGAAFLGKTAWALAGCVIGYGLALGRGYRSLEGMNGDIAGYALTLGELAGIGVYALL